MITRRMLVLTGMVAPLAGLLPHPTLSATPAPAPPAPSDPLAIVNAIYARVIKGKGNGGGGFVIENKAAKAKYLSKSLIKLWAAADAHTPKGDVGPVDFDPVTNSQQPDIKSFDTEAEKLEPTKAVIAVTITSRTPLVRPADKIIRYSFVLEGKQWKIDDISGTSDGEAWSIRDMLTDSLKEVT